VCAVSKKTAEGGAGAGGGGGGGAVGPGAATLGVDSGKPAVKPPYTYTELIEQALSEKGPLTVAEIYRWIS